MAQLEGLQYSEFAFAFMDDDIEFASTSTASSCITPQLMDYLRSVIVASKSYSLLLMTEKRSCISITRMLSLVRRP